MAIKKVESQFLEYFWKYLTFGASSQLKNKESQSEVITGFSPNNIRRVIIGLDGVFIQRYVSEQSGYIRKMDYREIKLKTDNVLPLMMSRAEDVEYVPVTAMLHKYRVFSSIEEIIVLKHSPFYKGVSLNNHGLDYFINESNKTRFKRLRYVTLVDSEVSVEELIGRLNELLANPLKLASPELAKAFKTQTKVVNDKDYLMHTSLRPQHYAMDEAGGLLYNYFEKTKQDYRDHIKALEVEAYKKSRGSSVEKQPAEVKLQVDRSFIKPYNELRTLLLKLNGLGVVGNKVKGLFKSLHKMIDKDVAWVSFESNLHKLKVDYDAINVATYVGLSLVKDLEEQGSVPDNLRPFRENLAVSLLVKFKSNRSFLLETLNSLNSNLALIIAYLETGGDAFEEIDGDESVDNGDSVTGGVVGVFDDEDILEEDDDVYEDDEVGETDSLGSGYPEKARLVSEYIPKYFQYEFSKLVLPLKSFILNYDTEYTETKEVYNEFLERLEQEINNHNLAIPLTMLITGRQMEPLKVNHKIALHPQLYYLFDSASGLVITEGILEELIKNLEIVCRKPEITQVTDLKGMWERVNARGGWTDDII